MTTTMDNLEKLIQMATIEHMYSMLQKMKNETSTNFKECNFSDETYSKENNALIGSLLNEIKHLKTEINDHTEKLRRNNSEIWQLTQSLSFWRERTEKLDNELNEIKNNTNNNSKFLCQQIRGQQKLTSYPGFSNGSPNEKDDEAHIRLKIEEKLSNDDGDDADNESNHSDDEEEEELEEEEDELEEEDDVNPLLITCSTITLDVKPIVEEVHQDEQHVEVSEEEEEESEEEVGTDDGKEDLGNVEVQNSVQLQEEQEDEELSVGEELGEHVEPVEEEEEEEEEEVVEEEEEVVEEEEEVVEEEEEEEVFEIEIDDVTYFATGEENGILYEMTADGDIGKKVGIIKDGEPIFN